MNSTKPKGYYLHYRDIYDPARKQTGIDQKVRDQIKALNELGCDCEFVFCSQPESTMGMVRSCLPFMPDGIEWPDIDTIKDADFIYIRIPRFISKQMLRFLEGFKKTNPNSSVILEVPTYPYDVMMKNWKLYPALLKDRAHRSELVRYVDRISDLSETENIFGIETVQIINGVDLDRVHERKIGPRHPDELNIMCSSFYRDYHGIDRLIDGLGDYYRSEPQVEVNLYLAGGGDELPRLKRMVKSLGLEDHVFFPGVLNEEELDVLYEKCSLAVGVLGLFRAGATTTSALKTREYLAKGMPFIYAGSLDVFDKKPQPFCLQFSNDDTPIDIHTVVAFYEDVYAKSSEEEVIKAIRDYAEDAIAMTKAMKNVANYINSKVIDR